MKDPLLKVDLDEIFVRDLKLERERTDANAELIQLLAQYLTDHPTERFGQALRNLGIVTDREVAINEGRGRENLEVIWSNEFYTEPMTTLSTVKKNLAAIEEVKRRGGF